MNLHLDDRFSEAFSNLMSLRRHSNVFSTTKLVIVLILAIVPISQVSSFGVASAQSDATAGVRLYQNPDYGIALFYPSDWERKLDIELGEGAIVGFRSPEENENDEYQETLEVLYNNLERGTTLDEYTKNLLQRYSDNLENFTIIESSAYLLSNSSIPSHRLVFSFSDGDYHYQAMNIWSVIRDKALIVIYYAEPKNYSTYLPIINKMIDSLQVNPDIFGRPDPGGQYVIPSLGFQAEIPHDWISIDAGTSNNSTLFKATPLSSADSNSTDRVLMFIILEASKQDGSIDIASRFMNYSDSDFRCGTSITSGAIVMVNGDIKALKSELVCSEGMVMKRIKSYLVASQDVKVIIGYGASTDSSYQKYLTDFDDSINRLQLADPTDLSNPNEYGSLLGLKNGQKQFEINGTTFTLDYASNSTITDLTLDEAARELSFRIMPNPASDNATSGVEIDAVQGKAHVFVEISDLMHGPFLVTFDDQLITDSEDSGDDADFDNAAGILTINDSTENNSAYLIISYDRNNEQREHQVAIVGTSVIPEFQVGMTILVLSAIIGFSSISSLAARKRTTSSC